MKSLIALLLLVSATSPDAAWHNKLVKSSPRPEAKLDKSPAEIRLWFKEPPEPKFSGITLNGPTGKKIVIGKVTATDDSTSIKAEITDILASGAYTVSWRASGTDGHSIRGKFKFTIK
jgi:methionine-rich copper-binding protein CopC